jgi:uncharacterized membrane protein
MSDWLEHSVQVEVPTPVDHVWSLWEDLERLPQWMKWLESVQIDPTNPELSNWKLKVGGFEFNWQSRIAKLVVNQIIQWESVEGLPNRGAIRFYDRKQSSIVRLTVAYSIPGFLRPLMDRNFLGGLVESALQTYLDQFRDYAIDHYASLTPDSPTPAPSLDD